MRRLRGVYALIVIARSLHGSLFFAWAALTAGGLGLEPSLWRPGRPSKAAPEPKG